MPIVYHPGYSPEFDTRHRFPMAKFKLLHDYLDSCGFLQQCQLETPVAASVEQIALAHDPEYILAYRDNQLTPAQLKQVGLPWTKAIMERTFLAVGGSLLTTKLALDYGLATHMAGGTHHAHYNQGSGFCIFNDLAICARFALQQPTIERVMIIDVDVHQGDGTARILAQDPNAITVSIHCKQNFPANKATSDFDFDVARHTGDEPYLSLIKTQIPYLLSVFQPDFVLYDAGVDPHENDLLGQLNLTSAGLYERDRFIIQACVERDIPISCVIGGGYMQDHVELAKTHAIVHQAALSVWLEHMNA